MREAKQYTSRIPTKIEATILNGQTKSEIIESFGITVSQIYLPAAFSGSTLSFELSYDGVNFFPYYNANNVAVAITCTQGRVYGLPPIDLYANQYMKIVSSTSEVADRSIILLGNAL
jgi:hypothetical protein